MTTKQLFKIGYKIYVTFGTAEYLSRYNIEVEKIQKINVGSPNTLDLIRDIINTLSLSNPQKKRNQMREATTIYAIPIITTILAFQLAFEYLKL